MKNFKGICIIALMICVSTMSYAGNFYDKNEVSISGSVGYYTLLYNIHQGKAIDKIGGSVGVGYLHLFSEHWGLQTGIEASFYDSQLSLSHITSVTRGLSDGQGHTFDFYSTLQSYKEVQKMCLLSIPIMAAFQTGDYNKFYLLAGVKIGLPIGDSRSTGTYVNRGYFPDKDNWAVDQAFMGFGRFEDLESKSKIDYTISVLAALEVGMKWYTGSNWSIYSGLYGEYGLNNIVNQKNKSNFITYESFVNDGTAANTVLRSSYQNEAGETVVFTNNVHPLAIGLRIRIAFGW